MTEGPTVGWTHVGDISLTTERLRLTPLQPDDAEAMVEVLADADLHSFIGGEPLALEELRDRYRRLAAGSPRDNEVWLNWIVRQRVDDQPVGTVQATLVDDGGGRWTAEVAWVIGVAWQRRGFASEAARALVDRLQQGDVVRVVANIHPDHRASELVAGRAGMQPTAEEVDGERVWRVDT